MDGFFVRVMHMRMPLPRVSCKAAFMALLVFCMSQPAARADWQRTDTTLAWRVGTNVLWQFSFDPQKGKPFFHPLTVAGGPALTNFKPADHPWHYGFWFSWKYINHVNYWEEDRTTGHAEGATRWTTPVIETQPDGSAVIRLDVTYTNPSNGVDMTESRELKVSAPKSDSGYTIDWHARFTAGKEGAILDRTPLLGEPDGKVNGGYAGLGIRMAGLPMTMSVVCTTGLVTHFESDRARPNAAAVGCNFTEGSKEIGGIAIFSAPKNAGENAPWYIINSEQMRFACAAILAPKIRTLAPGEQMNLDYRMAIQPQAWTTNSLQTSYAAWLQTTRPTH
jgi:hypothetical protein